MIDIAIGNRELGKSTLARRLASERRRQLIIDPRAQWDAVDPYRSVEHGNLLEDLDAARPIVIQPIDLDDTIDRLAYTVQAWLLERGKDPHISLSIIFDEAGLYSLKAWGFVFRCSPRQHTSLILTAHRFVDINTTIRSIADTWRIFRTSDPLDLQPIRDRCGDSVADRVSTLAPYQFVTWYQGLNRPPTQHLDGSAWREPLAAPIDGGEPIVVASRGGLF
jgi:hypothetical protein